MLHIFYVYVGQNIYTTKKYNSATKQVNKPTKRESLIVNIVIVWF